MIAFNSGKISFIFILFMFLIQLGFNVSFANDEKVFNKFVSHVSYADAVEKSMSAVVSIQTTQEVPINTHPMFNDPIFKFFFW